MCRTERAQCNIRRFAEIKEDLRIIHKNYHRSTKKQRDGMRRVMKRNLDTVLIIGKRMYKELDREEGSLFRAGDTDEMKELRRWLKT